MLGSRLVNAFFYFQNVVWLCRMLGDIIVKLVFFIIIAAHLEMLLFM